MNLQQLKEGHHPLYEQLIAQARQELLAETDADAGQAKEGSETVANLSVSDQFSSMSASVLAKRAENERARLPNGQAE